VDKSSLRLNADCSNSLPHAGDAARFNQANIPQRVIVAAAAAVVKPINDHEHRVAGKAG